MSRRTALRGLLGIAISVIAGVILLRSVDVAAAIDVLRQANLAIVALMGVSVVLDVAARGARWQALLAYFDDDALLLAPCHHCDNDPPLPDETARLGTLRRSVEALVASAAGGEDNL